MEVFALLEELREAVLLPRAYVEGYPLDSREETYNNQKPDLHLLIKIMLPPHSKRPPNRAFSYTPATQNLWADEDCS